jgi:hypothetical protein
MEDYTIGTKQVKVENASKVPQIYYNAAGVAVKIMPGKSAVIEVIDPNANENRKKKRGVK